MDNRMTKRFAGFVLEESRGSSAPALIVPFHTISVGTFLEQQIASLFRSALNRNRVKVLFLHMHTVLK